MVVVVKVKFLNPEFCEDLQLFAVSPLHFSGIRGIMAEKPASHSLTSGKSVDYCGENNTGDGGVGDQEPYIAF